MTSIFSFQFSIFNFPFFPKGRLRRNFPFSTFNFSTFHFPLFPKGRLRRNFPFSTFHFSRRDGFAATFHFPLFTFPEGTASPQFSTFNYQLSIINYQLSIINYQFLLAGLINQLLASNIDKTFPALYGHHFRGQFLRLFVSSGTVIYSHQLPEHF